MTDPKWTGWPNPYPIARIVCQRVPAACKGCGKPIPIKADAFWVRTICGTPPGELQPGVYCLKCGDPFEDK